MGVLAGVLSASSGMGAWAQDLKADGKTNLMPTQWEEAFPRIITTPDTHRLEQGDILCEIKKTTDRAVIAQSMGLIKSKPEECFKAVRRYNL
jgi:hypothetical protein